MYIKLSLKISLEGTRLETEKPLLSKCKADILSSSITADDCLFGSALVEVIGLCLGPLDTKAHFFNTWNTLRRVRCSLYENKAGIQTNGEKSRFLFVFHPHSRAYVLWVRCLAKLPMLFTLKLVSASHLKMFDGQK